MHELSIALAVVEAAEEEASHHAAARVIAVRLRVGGLAGVVPAALRSAFELAREGSSLDEARLEIEEVPVVIFCSACAAERSVEPTWLCCDLCGAPSDRVVSGRELELCGLEIEELLPS